MGIRVCRPLYADSLTGPNYNVVVVYSGNFSNRSATLWIPIRSSSCSNAKHRRWVQHVTFVAEPFHVMPLAPTPTSTSNRLGSSLEPALVKQPRTHAFSLPGHGRHLATSANFLPQAMRHFIQEVGSHSFSSLNPFSWTT
jgi:hypothetical protein